MVHRQTGSIASASGPQTGTTARPPGAAWAAWLYFAAVIMVIVGALNVMGGLVALLNREYYRVTADELLVEVDYAVWGWTLLIYGTVFVIAGLGLLVGRWWAAPLAVISVFFNALLNLAFAAASPIWSVIVIALDVTVLYAIVVHGRGTKPR